MHPILQLDRSGWTYRDVQDNAQLVHVSGVRLSFEGKRDITQVYENGLRMVLEFPRPTSMQVAKDQGQQLWAAVEASAGTYAQDRFQRTHAFIRQLCILSGHTQDITLNRFSLGWMWQMGGHRAQGLFGGLQSQVDQMIAAVEHVSLPNPYGAKIPAGFWTHHGTCCWPMDWSGHERLEVLDHVRQHGVVPAFAHLR